MENDPDGGGEIHRLENKYRKNPDSLVFARLADEYRKAGDPQKSLALLDEGIGRHRDYPSAHIIRARTLIDLEQRAAAEDAYLRVLELDAANLVAMRGLAALARERGDLAAARTWFQRISGLDAAAEPVPAAEPVASAEPVAATDVPVEGAWWFEDPDDGGGGDDGDLLTRTMADLYEKQGLFQEAAAIYKELLSDRPDDPELRAALAALESRLEVDARPVLPRPEAALPETARSGRSEVFLDWLRRLGE